MATTNPVLPASTATASESPWSDNNWSNASYVTADDTNYASVTASQYDSGDQTYVLKAYNFDFSSIPNGSQILGVTCTIRSWYANGAGSLDLVQLLNTSLAKVGTNKAATPQALTTSEATYTFGGSADLWGNALTPTWVKNSNFGVAVGCYANANDCDVFIDWIKLEITYRPPITIETTSFSLTGTAVALVVAVPAVIGSYGLTGTAAGLSKSYPVSAGAGSYEITGSDVTLKKTSKLPVGVESYSIDGQVVTVKLTGRISIDADSYTITGSEITFGTGARKLTAGGGEYLISSIGAALESSINIYIGNYSLTGSAVTLRPGKNVSIGEGSYALSGQDVSLEYGREVAATGGEYVWSGQSADLKKAGYGQLESGSLAITGSEVTLTYVPSGVKEIVIGDGSYSLTGSNVALQIAVPTYFGSYALTGSAATLQKGDLTGKGVIAGSGSYAISGTAQGLVHTVWFDPSNYFITGTLATLRYSKYNLLAGAGTFVVIGHTGLQLEIGMPAGAGAYAIAGTETILTHNRTSAYIVGAGPTSYSLIGSDVGVPVARKITAEAPVSQYVILNPHDAFLKLNRSALQPSLGEYLLTGDNIEVDRTYVLTNESGEYLVSGSEATIGKGAPPAISADGGTYEISGVDAEMRITGKIVVESAAYSIEWVDVSLLKVEKFSAETAEYAVVGSSVETLARRTLTHESGEYVLDGGAVTLARDTVDYSLAIDAGSYEVSGTAVGTAYGYNLVIGDVAYEVTGTVVNWKRTYILTAGSGYYGLSGLGGRKHSSTFWRRR